MILFDREDERESTIILVLCHPSRPTFNCKPEKRIIMEKNNKVGMVLIAVIVFSVAGYSLWKMLPNSKPFISYPAVPVIIDTSRLQAPTADQLAYVDLTFNQADKTIALNGIIDGKFSCVNGGVVHFSAASLHFYYDCDKGTTVSSKMPYPTDIGSLSDEDLQGISDWNIIGIDDIVTKDGWRITLMADSSIRVISPLGDELSFFPKTVARRDGNAYVLVKNIVGGLGDAYDLYIGTPGHTSSIVIRLHGVWMYHEIK